MESSRLLRWLHKIYRWTAPTGATASTSKQQLHCLAFWWHETTVISTVTTDSSKILTICTLQHYCIITQLELYLVKLKFHNHCVADNLIVEKKLKNFCTKYKSQYSGSINYGKWATSIYQGHFPWCPGDPISNMFFTHIMTYIND